MNIFMIAKNNIKKAKLATATLIILIAMATIFLYVGISVLSNLDTFIENKNIGLNGAHFISIADGSYDSSIDEIYESIAGFDYREREDALMSLSSKFQNVNTNEEAYAISSIILNLDTDRSISKVEIIDAAAAMPENGVVVPYVLKVANGYQTGDNLKFIVDDKSIDLVIAGFYEDLMFASPSNVSMYKLYVGDSQFSELLSQPAYGFKCSYSAVITDDLNGSEEFESQYTEKIKPVTSERTGSYATLNYETMKTGVSIFIHIIMAVLVAFSIIILLIAFIVIKFSTTTHIENNIKNIGTLEAMGYTTTQILNAILLEYLLITGGGYIIGVAAAFGISPAISNVVSSSIGLRWLTGINPQAAMLSLGIIMLSVLGISYFSAVKIKKITPLTALRNGIETHHFNKNRVPLDNTRLGLNTALGLKSFFFNKKQNIIAGIIIMLLSLVCVFAFAMYYNFTADKSAMIKLIGLETAEVQLRVEENNDQLLNDIADMSGVESTIALDTFDGFIAYNGHESRAITRITDDYRRLKVDTCVKGRMPVNDNEIAITSIVLDSMGAKIADTVSIEYTGVTKEFLVVGVIQQFNMLGKGAAITTNGMKKLMPSYEAKNLMIYLNDNQDTDEFVTHINNLYSGQNIQCASYFESIELMLDSFESAVKIVVTACLAIIAVIIVFIMFLVIRVRLLGEKIRLGVSKALGFTSNQLICQILISEMPVIIGASLVGAIAGYYLSNPLMAVMLAPNGILNCDFFIAPGLIALTTIGISLLGLGTLLIVSGSIRKISPWKMFEEGGN
ncbi:ABC transporter permease [Acetobacterium bakii]|uniref:ABC3 transporter permease C-terminal domain-containing protein n=1 Tax=Acetobacterium bakii TaxID=52689 RepID=A0A0L6TXQ4_9FIRM|nr:ABC transporter permease [Acetobacterium bakii]KNZ40335.1 hypothetical protein AKG39_18265 [Acetobacterium bakii]